METWNFWRCFPSHRFPSTGNRRESARKAISGDGPKLCLFKTDAAASLAFYARVAEACFRKESPDENPRAFRLPKGVPERLSARRAGFGQRGLAMPSSARTRRGEKPGCMRRFEMRMTPEGFSQARRGKEPPPDTVRKSAQSRPRRVCTTGRQSRPAARRLRRYSRTPCRQSPSCPPSAAWALRGSGSRCRSWFRAH